MYTPKTYARHPKTPSRHRPDTPRHHTYNPRNGRFYTLEGTGRKGNLWESWPNIICCQYIWYWYILRQPQTPSRHHPDTRRHHPDTPRHTSFYTIEGTRRKGYIWVSWPNIFSNISFIGSSPDTLRHLPDTTKHNSDTSRPRRLYAIEGAGSKGNVSIMSYHELLQIDLLLTHPPDNPRHHRYPQTPSRHHPDTPRQRVFCIRGYWKRRLYLNIFTLIWNFAISFCMNTFPDL